MLGDKGYSSAADHRTLSRRGIAVTIPERADQLANRKRRGSADRRPYAFDPTIPTTATSSNAASTTSKNPTALSWTC